jgi:crotonobetainyl-CoA:carnitine CoA-transferase CaiB-like acyl-CoA transferase
VQPPRRANRDPNLCPHGVFPTVGSQHSDDEWVALAVQGQDQWASFCAAVGHPELINDQRFAHHEGRKRNEDVLDEIIAAWTSRRDKWDVADLLQAAGVAAAPVEHLAETYERDPQLQHHYQIVQQPSRPDIDIPINREAAQWVGHELRLMRSPLIGEHNQHVVCEILGHDEEHYVELIIGDVLS